ncbi:MAG: GNAT family protein, partial [Myxococcota bacterium]
MATRLRDLLPCRGPRVLLRRWRASDADSVRHWYRPGHRWHDLNGPYFADPTEEEADQMAGRIGRVAADGGPKGPLRLLPIARADDEDHLLGTVSRYAIDETNWTAAGVVVFDDANWNQGLGREALGLWIDLL